MSNSTYTITAPEAPLNAAIRLPASKSISNRALILHALAHGTTVPENLSDCDDTRVMIRAFSPEAKPTTVYQGEELEVIDIMAAGTSMRFLTAYLSVTPGRRIITGTERMQNRPIKILVDALRSLGADIEYIGKEGYPPLLITGKDVSTSVQASSDSSSVSADDPSASSMMTAFGHQLSLPGNVSSQYISALLMIGAVLPKGLTLRLTGDIISRPYINMTLRLMETYGAEAAWTSDKEITVQPTGYQDVPFCVESDWSAASYWYEILALGQEGGEVSLHGLYPRSTQGDSRGAEVFAKLGIRTAYTDQGVTLTRLGTPVARLIEDMVDIPDLAQTFTVTCCLMNIPFRFTGLQSLKIKETDRIHALKEELRKLGYVIHDEADSILYWNGERCPATEGASIATYEDHRMAMAFAPAAEALPAGGIRISEPAVVSKSYPAYWDHLKRAGFTIKD